MRERERAKETAKREREREQKRERERKIVAQTKFSKRTLFRIMACQFCC